MGLAVSILVMSCSGKAWERSAQRAREALPQVAAWVHPACLAPQECPAQARAPEWAALACPAAPVQAAVDLPGPAADRQNRLPTPDGCTTGTAADMASSSTSR